MDDKQITILLFCMGLPFLLFVISLGLYALKEQYFRAKFLDALDRGELMKIVRSSSNTFGISSFDLADYYHVNRTWLVMQARIAGFQVTGYDSIFIRYDSSKE